MKKIFNKILFLFLMLFSLFSFVFAEVNPSYTNYENLSDTENLVTVMWANENFDPEHPDTFFEVVE